MEIKHETVIDLESNVPAAPPGDRSIDAILVGDNVRLALGEIGITFDRLGSDEVGVLLLICGTPFLLEAIAMIITGKMIMVLFFIGISYIVGFVIFLCNYLPKKRLSDVHWRRLLKFIFCNPHWLRHLLKRCSYSQ
jgi:hypothetical protein